MEGASTDSIRAAASKWTLAGDDCLLNLLQSTHQRIITKCQDVNAQLVHMATALDDANINLQNVNNKFMALSNIQFIESRVYDDDEESTDQPAQVPPTPAIDELSLIKSSLAILERTHETAEILDDSESDSDTEISVVLKPKDLYSNRPLPYIIGTPSWKNKWHAGLIEEDSDTDSTTSKHDGRELDQYSDTESDVDLPRERIEDQTISETSSSLTSSHRVEDAPVAQKPADIAAELARRLGGPQPRHQEREEYTPPVSVTRKAYKPEQPAASTIFFDEPPPLDEYAPDDASSEDDIFDEINKNKPYTQRNTKQNNLAEDLFSFDKPDDEGDIFSDFAQQETKPSKQKSTLFEDEPESDLFVEAKKEVTNNNNIEKDETNTKKPVGGISLFGTNKGAESIGAAILQRNRRKSSTSADESGSDVQKEDKLKISSSVPKNVEAKSKSVAKSNNADEIDNTSLKKEKDILEDLFSKPKATEKKTPRSIVKEPVTEKVKDKKEIIDLFKDNIFDDIDDIFSGDVKIPPKQSNQKSIFDDDDDDLFSDIATKPKTQATNIKESQETNNKKSIFDSDDELFSDVKTIDTKKPLHKNVQSDKLVTKQIESQRAKTEDEQTIKKVSNENDDISNAKNIVKTTEKTKERNLFDDSPQNVKSDKSVVKSKGIFSSDSEEDIFASIKKQKTNDAVKPDIVKSKPVASKIDNSKQNTKLLTTESIKTGDASNLLQSPLLFEDDEIEDLFVNTNKLDTIPIPSDINAAEIKNIPPLTGNETIAKDITIASESKTLNVDSKTNNDLPEVETPNSNFVEVEQDKTETLSKEIDTNNDIFDDENLPKDDIFSNPIDVSKDKDVKSNERIRADVLESSQEVVTSKVEKTKNNIQIETQFDETKNLNDESETFITKANIEDPMHSIFDDDFAVPVEENSTLKVEKQKSISKEPDIFDDIFSEPPEFEKPTEPKKSKNVNALFDDDSDDESLFFKKNDVISDEKPEIFSSNANFDIFVSEPPAIDVDFTTKTNNSELIEDNTKSIKVIGLSKDEGIGSVPVMEEKKAEETNTKHRSYDDFSNLLSNKTQYEHNIDTGAPTDIFTPNRNNNPSQENPGNSFLNNNDDDENLFSTSKVKKHAKADNLDIKAKNTFGKDIADSDDDLFSSLPKPNIPESRKDKQYKLVTNDESYDEFNYKETEQNKTKSLADVTEDEFNDMFKSKESLKSKKDNEKKIGKLNTKNFNINVNALIPGASPKKVPKETQISQESEPKMVKIFPTNDETDNKPKVVSLKAENKNASKELIESKTAKSITFEDKPDSGVLDNNLSKQRAKIQVKRRPSSRRARHEAVRKSAIDFDDTDNSSSFDEPVKRVGKVEGSESNTLKYRDEIRDKEIDIKDKPVESDTMSNSIENVMEVNANKIDINIPSHSKINNDVSDNTVEREDNTNSNMNQNVNEQKSTTKIVYILNDEDIFNTSKENDIFAKNIINTDNNEASKSENDIFGRNDINDDIFGAKTTESNSDDIFKTMGVNTLGKSYKEQESKLTDASKDNTVKLAAEDKQHLNTTKSATSTVNNDNTTKSPMGTVKNQEINFFNDKKSSQNIKSALFSDSDEELFNKPKKLDEKVVVFDSDSEEDLFTGKKRTEKQSKEKKNQEVRENKEVLEVIEKKEAKASLFGDDDDDLFGDRKVKLEQLQAPTTSKATISSKSAEPVFDDPLSMFDD